MDAANASSPAMALAAVFAANHGGANSGGNYARHSMHRQQTNHRRELHGSANATGDDDANSENYGHGGAHDHSFATGSHRHSIINNSSGSGSGNVYHDDSGTYQMRGE